MELYWIDNGENTDQTVGLSKPTIRFAPRLAKGVTALVSPSFGL